MPEQQDGPGPCESCTGREDDLHLTKEQVWGGAVVLGFLALWCGAVFSGSWRGALSAGGESVAAVGTIAGVAATFFALRQLGLQREANAEQHRLFEAQLAAQAASLQKQLDAQTHALREDHRLQRLAVTRDHWAAYLSSIETASMAIAEAQATRGMAGSNSKVATMHAAYSTAAVGRTVVRLVDGSAARRKIADGLLQLVADNARRVQGILDGAARPAVDLAAFGEELRKTAEQVRSLLDGEQPR
jgi:hypothetical protein